jgi:hypothetical protein
LPFVGAVQDGSVSLRGRKINDFGGEKAGTPLGDIWIGFVFPKR